MFNKQHIATLIKKDFREELSTIFGVDFSNLGNESQIILLALYQHNKFGKNTNTMSANQIGNFTYFQKHKKIENSSQFEAYKRRVRSIFNQLENKGYITRKDGKSKAQGGKPNFEINFNFDKTIQIKSSLEMF